MFLDYNAVISVKVEYQLSPNTIKNSPKMYFATAIDCSDGLIMVIVLSCICTLNVLSR